MYAKLHTPGLLLLYGYLQLLSITETASKTEACFASTLRIILPLHAPFLFLGTSFTEAIL